MRLLPQISDHHRRQTKRYWGQGLAMTPIVGNDHCRPLSDRHGGPCSRATQTRYTPCRGAARWAGHPWPGSASPCQCCRSIKPTGRKMRDRERVPYRLQPLRPPRGAVTQRRHLIKKPAHRGSQSNRMEAPGLSGKSPTVSGELRLWACQIALGPCTKPWYRVCTTLFRGRNQDRKRAAQGPALITARKDPPPGQGPAGPQAASSSRCSKFRTPEGERGEPVRVTVPAAARASLIFRRL